MYSTSPTCQIPGLANFYQMFFGDNYVGSFVEVGAFDGLTYSNTYGLATAGWKGLYIEAIEEYYLKCIENHKNSSNVMVLNKCVGMGNTVELFKSGEYSSYNMNFITNAPDGWGVNVISSNIIKTEKLDDILEQFWSGNIDILSIDVEGSEADVLRGFSVSKWQPRIAIIEVHEKHHNDVLHSDVDFINRYFKASGYKKIFCDDLNNIYMRN